MKVVPFLFPTEDFYRFLLRLSLQALTNSSSAVAELLELFSESFILLSKKCKIVHEEK